MSTHDRPQRGIMLMDSVLPTASDGRYQDDDTLPINEADKYVDALAKTVRSIYCVCVRELRGDATYGVRRIPQWDGGTDSNGNVYSRPVWPKVAAVIIRNHADPFMFIRAQFQELRTRTTLPKPNQFHNQQAIEKWQRFSSESQANLRRGVASDFNQIQVNVLPFTVNLQWEHVDAISYVLKDPKCGASPLVRCCVAHKESLPIPDYYKERAVIQYLFQMAEYDEVLGDQIPEDIRAEASRIRGMLVGQ